MKQTVGSNSLNQIGVDATITIAPTGEAQSIRLTDMGFTFSYSAHLYIYEGTAVDDTHLLKDVTGSSAKFDPIIVDGPVTLKYVGRGSYTKPNFAVLAEGYKKADVTILGVTAEDISISEVLKGQTDVKMLKIAVEAEGELTPATITAFNVTADGQAAAAQHIYQTGTSANFSTSEELNGSDYKAIPFKPDDEHPSCKMKIGYIVKKNLRLSKVGQMYVDELKNYLKVQSV